MRFVPTRLSDAFVVETEPHSDSRGLFARTFCSREFAKKGLTTSFVQCSTSFNTTRGTIRGLHYQLPPEGEVKLIRCTAGAILDVIVDLRPNSSTYLEHFSVELNAKNRLALYVPKMFAHGFQTLEDNTEIYYQISEYYLPDRSAGLRFDDPKLGILWPLEAKAVSEKDRTWSLLS